VEDEADELVAATLGRDKQASKSGRRKNVIGVLVEATTLIC